MSECRPENFIIQPRLEGAGYHIVCKDELKQLPFSSPYFASKTDAELWLSSYILMANEKRRG